MHLLCLARHGQLAAQIMVHIHLYHVAVSARGTSLARTALALHMT